MYHYSSITKNVVDRFKRELNMKYDLKVFISTYHHLSITKNVVNHFERKSNNIGWEIIH